MIILLILNLTVNHQYQAALGETLELPEPDGLKLPLGDNDADDDALLEPLGDSDALTDGLAEALPERPEGAAALQLLTPLIS